MKNLSNVEYWNNEWKTENRDDYRNFVFKDLIKKFIPQKGDFIEIGCAPGNIMTFFHKCMLYNISGIDYSNIDSIETYLKQNNVLNYKIYNEDFTKLVLTKQFDVVSSFGFVEHFEEIEKIIDLHKKLVKEQGYLIVEIPNLRYFNWLLYRIFKPELLKMHNLNIMRPNLLRQIISNSGEYKILFCNYYKSSCFQFNENNIELDSFKFLKKVFFCFKRLIEFLNMDNIPNKYFSPYIIVIAQKD